MKLIIDMPEVLYDRLKYEKEHHMINVIHQDYSPNVLIAMPNLVLNSILNGKIVENSLSAGDLAYRDLIHKT